MGVSCFKSADCHPQTKRGQVQCQRSPITKWMNARVDTNQLASTFCVTRDDGPLASASTLRVLSGPCRGEHTCTHL